MKVRESVFFLFVILSYIPVLAQVDTAWVRKYNGPANSDDYATAIAVDTSGNVYITGHSGLGYDYYDFATIKYAPNGDTLWVRRYSVTGKGVGANAVAVDAFGNVYVTGGNVGIGTSSDYATIKYAPNGDSLWVRRYNGPANDYDVAYALAVDVDGNVYVTGTSIGDDSSKDYATIKYAPNGDSLWVKRYSGPGNSPDEAFDLAVDSSGNVYVTGYCCGSSRRSFLDYLTIKYAPNGDTLWVRRYDGPGGNRYNDISFAIAIDENENVYVTGQSDGGGTSDDFVTIKYASNGDILWLSRYDGPPGHLSDYGKDVAVDKDGSVYVTGFNMNDTSYGAIYHQYYEYATIKYNSNGDTLWVRRYRAPDKYWDEANALAIDKSGNVYVTGYSFTYETDADYATIRYSTNGDSLWVRRYNQYLDRYDKAYAITVDDNGNVYVTGGSRTDYVTIKYIQFDCIAKPGDVSGDTIVDLSDIIFKVNYIFKGGLLPLPLCSGDDNADGKVNLTDIIYEVNYIFKGGPAPKKSKECCL